MTETSLKVPTWLKPRRKLIIWLCLAVALFILLLPAIRLDIQDRIWLSKMNGEVSQVQRDFLEPAGAVEYKEKGYPDIRGNGLLDVIFRCAPDVKCPRVGRIWYVPIAQGEEQKFARDIALKEGYAITLGDKNPCTLMTTSSCGISAIKDNLQMSVDVDKMEVFGARSPNSRDVSPKVWRLVLVSVGLK